MITIEIILWIASFIIISELLFIFWLKGVKKKEEKEEDYIPLIPSDEWITIKILSFIYTSFFFLIQFGIVGALNHKNLRIDFTNLHYINLLYEALVILIIAVFYLVNKMIYKKIEGK